MQIAEILVHALKDGVYMLPFLFAAYVVIEYIEQSSSEKMENLMRGFGRYGAIGGALFGCVPQCGFSAAAANFYSNKVITIGTLLAVFLSTSDEAVVILFSCPGQGLTILKLIAVKVVIAALVGFFADLIIKREAQSYKAALHIKHSRCHDDGGGIKTVLVSAVKHTFVMFVLIFIITALLGTMIELLGESRLSQLFVSKSWIQPFISALVGFVPNCASSVLLAQLYANGILDFGALVAGLCTGTGVGIIVLFKENRPIKENFVIMAVMYAVAVIAGILL